MSDKTYFLTNKFSINTFKKIISNKNMRKRLYQIRDIVSLLGTFPEGIYITQKKENDNTMMYFYDEEKHEYKFNIDDMYVFERTDTYNRAQMYSSSYNKRETLNKENVNSLVLTNVYTIDYLKNIKLYININVHSCSITYNVNDISYSTYIVFNNYNNIKEKEVIFYLNHIDNIDSFENFINVMINIFNVKNFLYVTFSSKNKNNNFTTVNYNIKNNIYTDSSNNSKIRKLLVKEH